MPSVRPRSQDLLKQCLALFLLLTALGGCATARRAEVRPHQRLKEAGFVRTDGSLTDLQEIYNTAIYKSAVFRPENEVGTLQPVTGPTQMGSLISCDCGGAQGACSGKCSLQPGSTVAHSDIWVSRADQFLQFCQSFPQDLTGEQVILKLQQLLGLPPQINQDACTWKVLQLEVDGLQVPEQFFRPCANPDPTTPGPCPPTLSPSTDAATTAFQAWLAGQGFAAWQLPHGYPWTRLGYTYNWDPQAQSIVGVSEYVIRQGSPINVLDLVPAIELCTQGRLTCPVVPEQAHPPLSSP